MLSFTRPGVAALCALAVSTLARSAVAQERPPVRPLSLSTVIQAAVEHHPLVDAAHARVQAARGTRSTAGVLPNPVLTHQVENAAFPGHDAPAGITRETSTFGTLPLEPLWQRAPRVRQAEEGVLAAEANLSATRRQVAGDAARAFFRVALAQIAVSGAGEIEQGLDSLVRYSSARVKEGAAAEGDLIRLQVERDRAATDRVLAQVELIRASATLAPYLAELGTTSDSSVVVTTDDSTLLTGTLPPAATFTSRMATRPDVLAARARARAAGAESALQRTMFFKQLGATFGTKTVSGINTMIAGISLPIPLFDQNRGEVQRASGERVAAEREAAWTERQAAADIGAAYASAQTLLSQVGALSGQFLSRAAEARRIAVVAYQEGAVPLLQVIDATRTLADARMTYYRALYARHTSLLELYIAAGLDPLDALTMKLPARGNN